MFAVLGLLATTPAFPAQSAAAAPGDLSPAACDYDPCLPPYPPDLDCRDVGRAVWVIGTDVHGLDADDDGIGCDAYGPPPPRTGTFVSAVPSGCSSRGASVGAASTADEVSTLALQAISATPSRLVPITPTRIVDTRLRGDAGYLCPEDTFAVPVAGIGAIPATGVSAVVLNITATATGGPGFVTVWPSGEPRPTASSMNLTAPWQTRANLVIVPVGANGRVAVVSQAGAHVVIDATGYFTAAAASNAGRFVPVAGSRLVDTRTTGKLADGATLTVQVTGRAGVPSGTAAVAFNLTGTEAAAAGFVTAWPAGLAMPTASNLNLGAGETAANLVIVPLSGDGKISLFAQQSTHLIADVVGYVTGPSAPWASSGLFVPMNPARVFDTRGGVGVVPGGWVISPAHGGVAGIPVDAAAVALTVTATATTAPAHVTTWPTGSPQPSTSTLNVVGQDTRANAAIVPLGSDGSITYANSAGQLHLLADATGYFTR